LINGKLFQQEEKQEELEKPKENHEATMGHPQDYDHL
jgi:hypothetical protein